MKKLLFFIALSMYGQYVFNPFTNNLDRISGSGATAAAGYQVSITAQTSVAVTAATHGRGAYPAVWCYDSGGAYVAPSVANSAGDLTLTFSPAFTGVCIIGSGTSGVNGGANLTTVGAIPYVSASGVLNQDSPGLHWDATNNRLGLGTASPATILELSSAAPVFTISATGVAQSAIRIVNTVSGGSWYLLTEATSGDYAIYGGSTPVNRLKVFNATGNVAIGNSPTTDGNFKFDVAGSGSAGTARFYDQTATTGTTNVVIRAGAGQSGNLQEWQNNAGTALASVSSAGNLAAVNITASGSLEANSTQNIGWTGRSKFASASSGVILLWNAAETDFNRLQFGGTTSSFPALKRSTTILQARLADDSADTQLQASRMITAQTTPSASTDACTAGAMWADATYAYFCTASGAIKRVTLVAF